MSRFKLPPFKEARWYRVLYVLVLIITTSSALWVMRSGALAMWDNSYSPESTIGPVFPWVLALPLALLGGIVFSILVMVELELRYERWRESRETR